MGELVGCIEGIGEAARALDFPVVSGNVSLYNETMGSGIPPTPAIGGVGLVEDVAKAANLAFKAAGEDILLVGGRRAGSAGPPGSRRSQAAKRARRRRSISWPNAATASLSRRSFEAARSARSMTCPTAASPWRWPRWRWRAELARNVEAEGLSHAFFFGEDQGRYVLTAPAVESAAIAEEAKRLGVPLSRIGVTGGEALRLGGAAPLALAALDRSL